MDFRQHNEEVKLVWDSFHRGRPIRVPVGNFTVGPRIWLLDPKLNTEGITWHQFAEDAEVMFQMQLKYLYYLVHNVPHDVEMGIPSKCWNIFTEFVNVYDAAWFGCDVVYPGGQVPVILHKYFGKHKQDVFERGMPKPFENIMAKIKEFYEYFVSRSKNYEFHGKPVNVLFPCPISTNGPLTIAYELRGEEIFSDIYLDPEYFHRLMDFITDASIKRIKAWRQYLGIEEKPARSCITDDMIELISVQTYLEQVLPYHKRILSELFGNGPHTMHLCGNVQRHLPNIVEHLNVKCFDTGFPIDFASLRSQVGQDVTIQGGVRVDILLNGSEQDVQDETIRILKSGIMLGGKFIMKEANNLPPCIPVQNIRSMYETVRQFGKY